MAGAPELPLNTFPKAEGGFEECFRDDMRRRRLWLLLVNRGRPIGRVSSMREGCLCPRETCSPCTKLAATTNVTTHATTRELLQRSFPRAAKTPRRLGLQALREAIQWGVQWCRLARLQTGIHRASLQAIPDTRSISLVSCQ